MKNKSRGIKGIWNSMQVTCVWPSIWHFCMMLRCRRWFCRRLWWFAWHCAASFAHYFWHPALGDTQLEQALGELESNFGFQQLRKSHQISIHLFSSGTNQQIFQYFMCFFPRVTWLHSFCLGCIFLFFGKEREKLSKKQKGASEEFGTPRGWDGLDGLST